MKFILYQTKNEFGVKNVEFCCYAFYRQLNINFKLQFSSTSTLGLSYIANQTDYTSVFMIVEEEIPMTHCPFCGDKIEIKWIDDDRLEQS